MAISRDRTQVFTEEYPRVFSAVCEAAALEEMTVVAADPGRGAITLKTRVTVWSWGENLHAQVFQVAPGSTSVTVTSSLKFGLVDWGKNARNLDSFFDRLQLTLAAAPAGAWHPDPTGRHQLRWWDGAAWRPEVSDGGQQSHDPIG